MLPIGIPTRTVYAASATTPTISFASSTLHPYSEATLTAQSFAPGETVSAYVVSYNNNPSASLTCDATGTCTGQLSLYGIDLAAGTHTLIATGNTSDLQAQTSFTLVPGIQVTPNQGGVGTSLEVDGAAFAANETVNIYWGSPSTATFVGSATCGQYGGFAFTNKANGDPFIATGAPGHYKVTVVPQNETSTVFTATFHILTPKIQAPASIKFGKPDNITVSGFGANETVVFSWNANGGQVLGNSQTDSIGRGVATFAYPSAPSGSYILTATGETSGLTTTDTVNVGAGIDIGLTSYILPGETLTINGGGFAPDQSVGVYFQAKKNGIVNITTDATGAFSASLTLPSTYSSTTSYHIHAISADSTLHAEVPVSFSPPDAYINVAAPTLGPLGAVLGDNFAVNETVNIYWNYGQSNQVQVGTATVDNNGHFSTTITPPAIRTGAQSSWQQLARQVNLLPQSQ